MSNDTINGHPVNDGDPCIEECGGIMQKHVVLDKWLDGNDNCYLECNIPVYTCSECGTSITDWEADDLRAKTLCDTLGAVSPKELGAIYNLFVPFGLST